MKENDPLVFDRKIGGKSWVGGILIILGILNFDASKSSIIAGVLGSSLYLILAGILVLMLRQVRILDPSELSVSTYFGIGIPGLVFKLPFRLRTLSLKYFNQVTIRHEQKLIPTGEWDDFSPPRVKDSYHVGFGNEPYGVWLITFSSIEEAEKQALEFEKLLEMEY